MRLRHLAPVVAASVAFSFAVPAAHADTTPEQFTALSQGWTLAQRWDWGVFSGGLADQQARFFGALHDNDLANAGDKPAIERVIRRTFTEDPDWAVAIARRESGLQPGAVNRASGAAGLFQMLGHGDMFRAAGLAGQELNAVANITVAHNLYLGAGRRPWSL